MNSSTYSESDSFNGGDGFSLNTYFWSQRIAVPLSLLIGVPGNVVAFLVFVGNRCEVTASSRLYYIVLAFMDEMALVFVHLTNFVGQSIPAIWDSPVSLQNNLWMCRTMRWLWIASEQVSNWTLVYFSIERIYVIRNPLRARSQNLLRPAAAVTAVTCVVCYGWMTVSFFAFTIGRNPFPDCLPDSSINPQLALFLWLQIYLFMQAFPTLFEAVCNVVIVHDIIQQAKARRNLTHDNKETKVSAKELSATGTLLAISTFHLIVYVPDALFWEIFSIVSYVSPDAMNSKFMAFVFQAATTMFQLTSLTRASNFVIYMIRMPSFRKEAMRIFCCKLH